MGYTDELEEIDDADGGSGSKLRKLAERVIAENGGLRKDLTASKANDVIRDKGYTFVKVTDLEEVALEDLETKAADLEASKKTDFESILRTRGEANGLAGKDLDAYVEGVVQGSDSTPAPSSDNIPSAVGNTRSAGASSNGVAPAVNPANLSAMQKLEMGLK